MGAERFRKVVVLGVILFAIPFFIAAKPSDGLECNDFESILNFVKQQHLRFMYTKVSDADRLLEAAVAKLPDTLRLMGYPVVAAHLGDRLSLGLKDQILSQKNSRALCGILNSTLLKTAYIKSYVRELDPYSDFFTTSELEAKTASLDGEFVGVGIGTEPLENALKVTEVVEDGPAFGKIQVGDLILSIDGHEVSGFSESEIRGRIRGEKGSRVDFSILRGEGHMAVSVVRGPVQQKSVTASWSDDKVLNIKIHRFFRQTGLDVEKIMREQGNKASGIILDLRNNPGGLLQAARDIVDLFVSQGVVVYLRGREIADQVWALREGGYTKTPLVVLVNNNTASASEIVAGALQDYGRAIIVGDKTYGKGSVQNIFETQSVLGTIYRGGLKLTTLWYYLPSGRSVRSLSPDILAAEGSDKVVNRMPYHGPDKIDVLREPSKISITTRSITKARALVRDMRDQELIGRALLKDMQANR